MITTQLLPAAGLLPFVFTQSCEVKGVGESCRYVWLAVWISAIRYPEVFFLFFLLSSRLREAEGGRTILENLTARERKWEIQSFLLSFFLPLFCPVWSELGFASQHGGPLMVSPCGVCFRLDALRSFRGKCQHVLFWGQLSVISFYWGFSFAVRFGQRIWAFSLNNDKSRYQIQMFPKNAASCSITDWSSLHICPEPSSGWADHVTSSKAYFFFLAPNQNLSVAILEKVFILLRWYPGVLFSSRVILKRNPSN